MITHNTMWNSCRESGDHGVINTWDRTPYLSLVRTGAPSLIPAFNNVTRNLMISNYNSFAGIDNDDGSSYYDISHNVFYLNECGVVARTRRRCVAWAVRVQSPPVPWTLAPLKLPRPWPHATQRLEVGLPWPRQAVPPQCQHRRRRLLLSVRIHLWSRRLPRRRVPWRRRRPGAARVLRGGPRRRLFQ